MGAWFTALLCSHPRPSPMRRSTSSAGVVMTQPARFKQCDVERILKAAKKCDYEEVRIRIDQNGQIEAIMGKAANDQPQPVELE